MMSQLKKDMNAVAKDLKGLTQKTEKMIRRLGKLEKAQAVKKPKARAAKKAIARRPTRVSASNTVLALIKRSQKGVDTATLKRKTGFNDRKIWNIINYLKGQGKVKSGRYGHYVIV